VLLDSAGYRIGAKMWRVLRGEHAVIGWGNLDSVRAGYQCAGCGEWNDTAVDECAGSRQEYVEDCQVCCKPNLLRVHWDVVAGQFVVRAELE